MEQVGGISEPFALGVDHDIDLTLPPERHILGDVPPMAVEAGNTLYESMSRFPNIFEKLDLAIVRLGEETGVLPGSLKELADFDFSAIPQLNKQRVLDLARGEYITKAEPIILVGNPGLGKTHISTGLALAACRQCLRVRFYNAAALVNELSLAQEQQRLPKFLASALKQKLIVLDELGYVPPVTSSPSLTPSPSVSAFRGSV